MIEATKTDLIDLLPPDEDASNGLTANVDTNHSSQGQNPQEIETERASIEQCLRICATMDQHIQELQSELHHGSVQTRPKEGEDSSLKPESHASHITEKRLEDCRLEISFTSAELGARLKDANHRLEKLIKPSPLTGTVSAPTNLDFEQDVQSIKQCLSLCEEATQKATSERVNVFEDVGMAEDGQQVIVSTIGDLISARRITAGSRSAQVLGQMSDESLQLLSNNFSNGHASSNHSAQSDSVSGDVARPLKDDKHANKQYEGRYGQGYNLSR